MFIEQDEIKAIQQFSAKNFSPALTQVHFCKEKNLIRASNSFTLLGIKGKLDKEEYYDFPGDIKIDISELKRITTFSKYFQLSKYDEQYMKYRDRRTRDCFLKYYSKVGYDMKTLQKSVDEMFDSVRTAKVVKVGSISLTEEFQTFTKIMKILGLHTGRKVVEIDLGNVAYYEDSRHIIIYKLGGCTD